MGRHTNQTSNGAVNEKTNPKFKWVRMLHVLDYHRWHHVKKNKKHNEKNVDGVDTNGPYASEPYSRDTRANMGNLQIEERVTEVNTSVESCPPNVEQQSDGSSPLPSSPPVKSSRAKRIKKLIMKEVIKRRGKHRRSLTCPAPSQITKIDASPQESKPTSESLHSEPSHNVEQLPTTEISTAKPSIDKCDLCNTRKIECHLGTKKHVMGDHDEHQLDQINMLFQDIHDEEINQLPPHNRNIGRSISFQHSKEFLEALDVLSVNKQFFLRILDDPGPSLRQHYFLNQQANTGTTSSTTTARKTLTKSGTFPSCEPSSSGSHSPDQLGEKHKSFSKEEGSFQEGNDENSGMVGKRFKDLGQKIKHLIRESRKERRRIAMDAVLHKIPVGKKVSEEDERDSPLLPISDQNEVISFSPNRTKDGSESKKPASSPLDQAMAEDRYRHLLQSTSFRVANSPERPRLRVVDETSSKLRGQKRDLRRILSSPDIQAPLAYQYDDNNHNYGYNSSRTPNRWATCFSERKAKDVPTMNLRRETHQGSEICKSNHQEKLKNKEDIPADDDENDDLGSVSKDECEKALCHTTADDIHHPADGSEAPTDMPVLEKLQEVEPTQQLSDDSTIPTFGITKVVETEAIEETPWDFRADSVQELKVDSNDEAEFKYVKDILKLSGYSGTQMLGSWESSEQPVDPSVFVELETCSLLEPEDCSPSKEGSSSNHLLLFDLINEVLLKMYERSVSYWPTPVCWSARTHPMPKGYRVLEEVWSCINWYMGSSKHTQPEQPSDYITTRDLSKDDGWMNLQFDAECVALEIEAIIFQDLLNELVAST